MVCASGMCATCTNAAACVPANPCHLGKLDCSTGTADVHRPGDRRPRRDDLRHRHGLRRRGHARRARSAARVHGDQPLPRRHDDLQHGQAAVHGDRQHARRRGLRDGQGLQRRELHRVRGGHGVHAHERLPHRRDLVHGRRRDLRRRRRPLCPQTGRPVGQTWCAAPGTCVTCATANKACTPSGTTCKTGATSCTTGTSVCQTTGNIADGTGCRTANVCRAGACIACAAGASCTPTSAALPQRLAHVQQRRACVHRPDDEPRQRDVVRHEPLLHERQLQRVHVGPAVHARRGTRASRARRRARRARPFARRRATSPTARKLQHGQGLQHRHVRRVRERLDLHAEQRLPRQHAHVQHGPPPLHGHGHEPHERDALWVELLLLQRQRAPRTPNQGVQSGEERLPDGGDVVRDGHVRVYIDGQRRQRHELRHEEDLQRRRLRPRARTARPARPAATVARGAASTASAVVARRAASATVAQRRRQSQDVRRRVRGCRRARSIPRSAPWLAAAQAGVRRPRARRCASRPARASTASPTAVARSPHVGVYTSTTLQNTTCDGVTASAAGCNKTRRCVELRRVHLRERHLLQAELRRRQQATAQPAGDGCVGGELLSEEGGRRRVHGRLRVHSGGTLRLRRQPRGPGIAEPAWAPTTAVRSRRPAAATTYECVLSCGAIRGPSGCGGTAFDCTRRVRHPHGRQSGCDTGSHLFHCGGLTSCPPWMVCAAGTCKVAGGRPYVQSSRRLCTGTMHGRRLPVHGERRLVHQELHERVRERAHVQRRADQLLSVCVSLHVSTCAAR